MKRATVLFLAFLLILSGLSAALPTVCAEEPPDNRFALDFADLTEGPLEPGMLPDMFLKYTPASAFTIVSDNGNPAMQIQSADGQHELAVWEQSAELCAIEASTNDPQLGAVEMYIFENGSAKHTVTAEFAWFADAVQYVSDGGLMNGTSDTIFFSKDGTTRSMIVTILYRQAGSSEVGSDGAVWWSDARAWAMEQGVSYGTNMEKPITRKQPAAMLYRCTGSEKVKAT